MVGWQHRLNGHGFGWTPGVGDGQGSLACCGSWGRKEWDTTERQQIKDFPGGSGGKESTCNAGDQGSIPESGRSPGEGNGDTLLILASRIPWSEEPGVWWVTVHGITKSQTRLSN